MISSIGMMGGSDITLLIVALNVGSAWQMPTKNNTIIPAAAAGIYYIVGLFGVIQTPGAGVTGTLLYINSGSVSSADLAFNSGGQTYVEAVYMESLKAGTKVSLRVTYGGYIPENNIDVSKKYDWQ